MWGLSQPPEAREVGSVQGRAPRKESGGQGGVGRGRACQEKVSQETTPRARAWGSHLDPREA